MLPNCMLDHQNVSDKTEALENTSQNHYQALVLLRCMNQMLSLIRSFLCIPEFQGNSSQASAYT